MTPLLNARPSCASQAGNGTRGFRLRTSRTGFPSGRFALLLQARPAPRSSLRAFSLVEIVLALGVITFALVALLGIVPTGLRINRETREEYQAQEILRQVLFERRQSLVLTNAASRFGFPTNLAAGAESQSLLSDQGKFVASTADARYELTYTLYGTNVTGSSKPWLGVRLLWPVGGSNSQMASLGMPWNTP